ncbi:hypothetical protein ACRALDRAFT_207940 [Sodiomyces alcalophilus JCM 7366]|uniref:uncharacterized protein n=1 Tax=Sodiomyces alcalophilus JCM 7366 TaxID=591952 RepID=UPI0039B6219F
MFYLLPLLLWCSQFLFAFLTARLFKVMTWMGRLTPQTPVSGVGASSPLHVYEYCGINSVERLRMESPKWLVFPSNLRPEERVKAAHVEYLFSHVLILSSRLSLHQATPFRQEMHTNKIPQAFYHFIRYEGLTVERKDNLAVSELYSADPTYFYLPIFPPCKKETKAKKEHGFQLAVSFFKTPYPRQLERLESSVLGVNDRTSRLQPQSQTTRFLAGTRWQTPPGHYSSFQRAKVNPFKAAFGQSRTFGKLLLLLGLCRSSGSVPIFPAGHVTYQQVALFHQAA